MFNNSLNEYVLFMRLAYLPGHAWKDIVHENTVQWTFAYEQRNVYRGE